VLFTKKKDEEKSIFSFTQFLAGLINASWKGGLFLVVLFLIVNVQLKLPYLSRIQNNIIESYTYATIYKVAGNKIPVISMDTENIKTIVEDPQKFQQLQSTESYKKLMDNQKIKDLYSDEDITRLAAEKNFVELIKNPKVQNLMQDKEILKDVFLLMKDIHNISKENQQ
ncbi:MAG: hypothetical protein KC618_01295, partial [Candidatus Omnitrophica bacterium]|nr:hypothetical protein [Candidatus Omnitrophota bacterium]